MFSPCVLCDKIFNAFFFNFLMDATYPSYISHPNNVCWVIKTVKPLISNILPYPVASVLYFNIPFIIHIPIICSFLGMRNIIAYSYSSVGLIMCILIIAFLCSR
jgi:hypothetical protein